MKKYEEVKNKVKENKGNLQKIKEEKHILLNEVSLLNEKRNELLTNGHTDEALLVSKQIKSKLEEVEVFNNYLDSVDGLPLNNETTSLIREAITENLKEKENLKKQFTKQILEAEALLNEYYDKLKAIGEIIEVDKSLNSQINEIKVHVNDKTIPTAVHVGSGVELTHSGAKGKVVADTLLVNYLLFNKGSFRPDLWDNKYKR